MKITGNTIFITGGGSGIGRGLAEALHKTGNQVIISGRRKGHLEEVVKANPGMKFVELNVEDPKSIESVAKKLIAEHPRLNVIVNNAGIMSADMVENPVEDKAIESIVVTNFLGPIRVTSAFIEHLKKQPSATVITVSSGLAFVLDVAPAPVEEHVGEGSGNCAAVGEDGVDGGEQRSTSDAAG
jgi:uncharacterized oxidoreductase